MSKEKTYEDALLEIGRIAAHEQGTTGTLWLLSFGSVPGVNDRHRNRQYLEAVDAVLARIGEIVYRATGKSFEIKT